MNCWLCNAPLPEDHRTHLVATVYHFWAKCCPACRKKYGALDENGKLTLKEDKH